MKKDMIDWHAEFCSIRTNNLLQCNYTCRCYTTKKDISSEITRYMCNCRRGHICTKMRGKNIANYQNYVRKMLKERHKCIL